MNYRTSESWVQIPLTISALWGDLLLDPEAKIEVFKNNLV